VKRLPRLILGLLALAGSVAVLVALLMLVDGDDPPERLGPTITGPATTAVPPPPPPPPAAPRLAVGIGEQHAAMFRDARFRDLAIDKVRRVTAYDATSVRFEWELLDNWLAEARAAGVEPFIAFGHSRVHPDKLPSVAEFRTAFRAFRTRYPDVRVYTAWNEINHSAQPTYRHPARAAEFYNVVRAECSGCLVVAGDVLDQSNMVGYLARYRRHIDGEPRAWGLHNYADANRFRDRGLRAMLKAVPGEIWLTETGGLLQLAERLGYDAQRAARAITYVMRLARAHKRVRRIYLYNWTGTDRKARFDSGLIAPDGTARPSYDAFVAALRDG